MTFHRDQTESEFIADGMSAKEAHLAAIRQFGNDALLRDVSHRITGRWLESIVQDFDFAMLTSMTLLPGADFLHQREQLDVKRYESADSCAGPRSNSARLSGEKTTHRVGSEDPSSMCCNRAIQG